MKIYTKGGDDGTTSLANGERVRKEDPRVSLYGEVDELNSMIGAAIALLTDECGESLENSLIEEQSLLFELGSELAGWKSSDGKAIRPEDVAHLESEIDRLSESLPALTGFILPGGSPAGGMLQVARTVCRRVERGMVAMSGVDPEAIRYINRLSDYLFTAARFATLKAGQKERLWRSRRKK